tara:strand:- start:1471 stop:2799 length:1329 start_codon:yes stop_codon:yes gene_type:complete
MKNIELKEFEGISSREKDKDSKEWKYDSDLPKKFSDEKDRELLDELDKNLKIEEFLDGLRVKAKRSVGKCQFSDFSISVTPRFVSQENLSRFLDFSYGFSDDFMISNQVLTQTGLEDNLLNIMISTFTKNCKNLIKRGLYKTYEEQIEDLKYLKGKLLLQNQIRNDFTKKLAFNCQYDDLITNNNENQICLHVLENYCYPRIENDEKKRDCSKLIKQFSIEVENPPELRLHKFDEVFYNRLNQHYESIHGLGKIIFQGFGISDFYKFKKTNIYSFFVPMHDVYEKFLEKLFEKLNYDVESQIGQIAWKDQDEKTMGIRTDILLKDNKKIEFLIDAKYKEELSPSDRYELGFYIHELQISTKTAYAILPYVRGLLHGTCTKCNLLRLKEPARKDEFLESEKQGIKIEIKYLDTDKILEQIYDSNVSEKQIRDEIKKFIKPLKP